MKTDTIGHIFNDVALKERHAIANGPVDLSKQKGITLFTALIFLIMLSLLGINAAQMSGLEERMAGNSRSRDLAFQAAEAALENAAQNLGTIGPLITSTAVPGATFGAGLRAINTCLPNSADYWSPNGIDTLDCNGNTQSHFTWTSGNTARDPGVNLGYVASQPLYVVERLPDVGTTQKYRVTSIGYGGDSNAIVILQALYCIAASGGSC